MLDLPATLACMKELPNFLTELRMILPPHYNMDWRCQTIYETVQKFQKDYLDKAIVKDNKD